MVNNQMSKDIKKNGYNIVSCRWEGLLGLYYKKINKTNDPLMLLMRL